MLVRKLLLVPLAVIIAWMIMAFFIVRELNVTHKASQLTLGSIGEPEDLNPISASSTSAAEVDGFLFNALLKYDENTSVVGDLAEDYRITQNSTAFFATAADAAAALDKLNAAKDQWPTMKLQAARQNNSTLILTFGSKTDRVTAGTSYQEELFKIIDRKSLRPVTVLTVDHDKDKSLPGGAKADSKAVMDLATAVARTVPGAAIHEIIPFTEALLSVSVAGDTQEFVKKLEAALRPVPATQAATRTADREAPAPAASIMESVDQNLLNEPVFTFKLREGVRWHDGTPLTAHDAAFTYRCLIDPQYRSPQASNFWTIKHVAVPDDYTFVVTYRYPFVDCLNAWMTGIVPRHILGSKDAKWWADNFNSKPIGSGPYRDVQWQRNEVLKLKANKRYYEGAPNLDMVVTRILPDPFVNQVAFGERGFDYDGLAPYQVARAQSDPALETFTRWGLAFDYVGWNLKRPIFQDKRVRRALAHAVNVDALIKYVYRGYAKASNGPYPFHEWYGSPDLPTIPYDPEKAKALLAEAGWKDRDSEGYLIKDGKRFKFNLITNNGNTIRESIVVLVQNDLKKIGIDVDVTLYEWSVFLTRYVDTKQFDACVLGWNLGRSLDQYQLWHSSQIAAPGGYNFCSYSSKEVDALLTEIRTTFDHDRLKTLCQRLQKVIYDDQPYLFLSTPNGTSALYKDQYVVRRPDGKGGWIVEPIRNTKMGPIFYEQWWAPKTSTVKVAR